MSLKTLIGNGKGGETRPTIQGDNMKKLDSMDFAIVVNDKNLQSTGLNRGQLVFVMGSRQVPAKKSDPYLSRMLVVLAKVSDSHIEIPSDTNDYKAYLADPRSLEAVAKDEQEKLFKRYIENR